MVSTMNNLEKYNDDELFAIFDADIEKEIKSRGYEYGWHKKVQYAGEIYILVNPAFPSLVKIGYADDVVKRVKSLNSNSGLPDPYHIYATYKVKKRLEDLKLHYLIDSLDSDLRHAKNREFYEMRPEKAFGILSAIAEINGDEDLLIFNPTGDAFFEKKEEIFAQETKEKKGPRNASVIPDGLYTMSKKRKSEGRTISATVEIKNGQWTLKAGSTLTMVEGSGLKSKALEARKSLTLSPTGVLLQDTTLGKCSPSFASSLVVYGADDGWQSWKDKEGRPIDVYRHSE